MFVDPVTLRLIALSVVCGVPIAVASAHQAVAIDAKTRLAAWHSAPGQQKSTVGCIDPNTANAVDWQQVPGVSRKTAQGIADHCQTTQTCARDRPPAGVKGVGPVVSAKLAAAMCGSAAVEAFIPVATPARKRHAILAPPLRSDSPR